MPTPTYTRGGNTAIAFVTETDYNDGVTTGDATSWVSPISESLQQIAEVTTINDLGHDASGLAGRAFSPSEYVQGDVVLAGSFDYYGILKRSAWGSVATTGAGPYTHTYTLVLDNPASMGAVMVRENTAGTKSEIECGGLQVPTAVYAVDARGFLQETYSLFGNIDTTWASATQTPAPPAPAIADVPLGKHVGTLAWNSGTFSLKSATFTVARQVSPDQFVFGSTALGQSFAAQNLDVMIEFTLVPTDYSWETARSAVTQSDAVLAFTSGTQSITFSLEDAYISSLTRNKSFGVDEITVQMKAASGGTFGAKMVVINDQSSAIVTQGTAA